VWHDVAAFGVEGRGWAADERKRWFDRFPARAEAKVPAAVWNLSRDSAGMVARFKTWWRGSGPACGNTPPTSRSCATG
jgi:hypothetical protein